MSWRWERLVIDFLLSITPWLHCRSLGTYWETRDDERRSIGPGRRGAAWLQNHNSVFVVPGWWHGFEWHPNGCVPSSRWICRGKRYSMVFRACGSGIRSSGKCQHTTTCVTRQWTARMRRLSISKLFHSSFIFDTHDLFSNLLAYLDQKWQQSGRKPTAVNRGIVEPMRRNFKRCSKHNFRIVTEIVAKVLAKIFSSC